MTLEPLIYATGMFAIAIAIGLWRQFSLPNLLLAASGFAMLIGILSWSDQGGPGTYEVKVAIAALGAGMASIALERERNAHRGLEGAGPVREEPTAET
jgi:hypothetical protein